MHALAFDARTGQWLEFSTPSSVLVASDPSEVLPVLSRVEEMVSREGLWAVGWVSYEAGAAIDHAFQSHSPSDFPLAWFALFPAPCNKADIPPASAAAVPDWRPSISQEHYTQAIAKVRAYIQRGDTYQVNFSFRLRADAPEDPKELFYSMVRNQAGPYSMYIDAGRFVLSSASPELFFAREGNEIVSRPMKGTAPRGVEMVSDERNAAALVSSEKERAENVMIVDMVRNDLSLIAEKGSVQALGLCEVERYPHVWQMISEVRARSSASLSQIFQALFPAASITGAPKKSTARIIRELECSPRNIYTGAMGVVSPDDRAWFNVAIRTALVDRQQGTVEYGVGSGVVWDSCSEHEFRECVAKASAVTRQEHRVALFETILWEPGKGFFLLERHMKRMARSAQFFSFTFDQNNVTAELYRLSALLEQKSVSQRVRLQLTSNGDVRCEAYELRPLASPYRLSLARKCVESACVTLYHKTTDRSVYDTAEPEVEGADDVLLLNERGELTESRIANVALELDGALYTPPVSSGLLPGCLREELLEKGVLTERVLTKDDLLRATRVCLLNSLRGMWDVVHVSGAHGGRAVVSTAVNAPYITENS